jgi:ATP-dependent Lhr-like helicase
MGDVDEMAKRYAPAPIIIDIGGGRDIDERYFSSLSEITDFLIHRAQELKKILVFANSRKRCEESASILRQLVPSWPVMVHHGSLSRKEREGVEAAMLADSRWICCATMTLEVGIDIGDIDAVCLTEPPWSVASLLQRIGRANRRSGTATVLALFEGVEQRLMYEEQFARAREGLLDRQAYRPDLSVVVQQVFSMLSGSPSGLADAELREPFSNFCSPDELDGILGHLAQGKHVFQRFGRWLASEEIMNLAETGRVYSNIQDSFSRRVVDGRNGQQVGEVNDVLDSSFMLAGRTWKVTRFEGNTIVVEPTTVKAGMPIFQIHGDLGAFAHYLPDALRIRSARPL